MEEFRKNMVTKIMKPSDDMWKKAIKSMVERGDLTVEQANKCYKNINVETKK